MFRLDLKTKTQIALTNFNSEQVAKIDWQPMRHFWFTSQRGKRIHNMIALPPNFDENKKYPLLVLMHGGPHTMSRDSWGLRWNYYMLSRPGYVVLSTNYSGSTGFGEKFAQSIQGDPLAARPTRSTKAPMRQFVFIVLLTALASGCGRELWWAPGELDAGENGAL